MKKALIILIVLAALGYGGWELKKWRDKNVAAPVSKRPSTATAEARDIHFYVNAAGDIGPADQVSVRPEVNGRISVLNVDIGDPVKKDDILFKLDDQDLQTELASQKIEIEQTKLQLTKSERDFKRAEALRGEKSLITLQEYDDAKTTFDLSKNQLEKAQKALSMVEDRLSKTIIMAPFDCTVLTRPVSVGQAVSGSGGFNSGTEIMTIANLNDLIVNAHINQADVTRLNAKQEVEIQIESVAGLKLKGVVERIAPQATIKNGIKGFSTRILLKKPDSRVRPGMTANVRIPVASAENVLALPLSAIFTEQNPDTQQYDRFVYVKRGETWEKRSVRIGVSDFFYAEVQEGLTAGESVSLELPADVKEEAKGAPTVTGTNHTKSATNAVGGDKPRTREGGGGSRRRSSDGSGGGTPSGGGTSGGGGSRPPR